jgi:heme/copper-type cytochrome/quinol oxidase subunit 2
MTFDRRQFLQLTALGGGAVFASSLAGCATGATTRDSDFYFIQLSDTHWGFNGPALNPDARGTLPKAVAAVNALEIQPDFIVFTGDLTHTTDDPAERRKRLAEFKQIASGLRNPNVRFMAGEHDASLDNGAAWKEFFGETYYSFDHKGIHFIALDNVSDPAARIGEAQLAWLAADLAKRPKDARIVVLTHRPLFDLAPQWDWATRDGAQAMQLLMPYANVTVFYGHIHQEHHHMTGHIAHHSAKSLIFPLPAPGSQPKREPIQWDASQPYKGLGWRQVRAEPVEGKYALVELPVVVAAAAAAPAEPERVVKVSARKFVFTPAVLELRKGVPVTLELTTDDVFMGFNAPDFAVRADIVPGKTTRIRFTPDKAGTFPFLCDVFCGDGHEAMSGKLVVT